MNGCRGGLQVPDRFPEFLKMLEWDSFIRTFGGDEVLETMLYGLPLEVPSSDRRKLGEELVV